jgi:hypothetical protein
MSSIGHPFEPSAVCQHSVIDGKIFGTGLEKHGKSSITVFGMLSGAALICLQDSFSKLKKSIVIQLVDCG